MTSKTGHEIKKFVMTSKIHHDTKKFITTSKTCERYVMTSKTSAWRQKICRDIKGMLWRPQLLHEVKNWKIGSILWCFVPEFSTIMCFSQFRWSWPLTNSSDISQQCSYHTQLWHQKVRRGINNTGICQRSRLRSPKLWKTHNRW